MDGAGQIRSPGEYDEYTLRRSEGQRLVLEVGEGDLADPVELLEGPAGGEVLVVEVGIAQVGFDEPFANQGLGDGGEDTDGDVPADPGLGPVPDGP